MPNMTTYNFGDIILVPFPFTDQSTSKKRPAVVISSDAYNNDRPDIILTAVTSQMRHLGKTGEAEVKDWQEAGLLKPSLIKPILTTIEKTLVLKKLGSLSVEGSPHTPGSSADDHWKGIGCGRSACLGFSRLARRGTFMKLSFSFCGMM